MNEGVSWGYYNNLTKQEPPVDWMITEGEDRDFADRIAMELVGTMISSCILLRISISGIYVIWEEEGV